MKIATFAALAFGSIASAIPAPAPAPEANALEARATSVSSVLTQLNSDLQGPSQQLSSYPSGAPYDYQKITDIVVSIQVIIDLAATKCKSASGSILDITVVVSLLVSIISIVIKACGSVYGLPGIDQVQIQVIVSILGVSLAALIKIVVGVLGVVVGLLVQLLVGLLGSVVINLIVSLKLTALISILAI